MVGEENEGIEKEISQKDTMGPLQNFFEHICVENKQKIEKGLLTSIFN